MIEYTYLPRAEWLALAGLLVGAVIYLSYRWAKGRSSRWLRRGLALLRWVTVAGLVFCLLDPEWVEALKHQQKSRVAVLLDTSRSMGTKDLPSGRLAVAKNWLRQEFTPAVPSDFAVKYYTFSDSLVPLQALDTARGEG